MIPAEPLIHSFIRSTLTVMDTMCGDTEISYEILSDKNEPVKGDIIGVMGIGGQMGGTVVVSFPKDIAEEIVSMMTGYEPEELDGPAINDGVTETLNMICGNSKSQVANSEYAFSLSIPTIISSSEYSIGYHHDAQVVPIRFDALGSSFYLYVGIRSTAAEQSETSAVAETNEA